MINTQSHGFSYNLEIIAPTELYLLLLMQLLAYYSYNYSQIALEYVITYPNFALPIGTHILI